MTGKSFLLSCCLSICFGSLAEGEEPNLVLILMDNLGYGELGVYGGGELRGGATPRIDELAAQGLRLTNFNTEAQCTPSRSALMTGRHPIRSGTHTIPRETEVYGLVQWEITLAEILKEAGYDTAIYGKWHLGHSEGRWPTNQGFDKWYGIANSTDESFWTTRSTYKPDSHILAAEPHILRSVANREPEKVKVYDREARRLIDGEISELAIDFIKARDKTSKPFFLFLPMTMPHYPIDPHPDFDGITGNGFWGDALVQMDSYTGQILDQLEASGIADNTIFIFASENGPEHLKPWHGWAGPWRGTYFTALEGGLRTPFIIRWPGKIPAGAVSNEIVHITDIFTTLIVLAGLDTPSDRIIDGVDQAQLFLGESETSNREGFPVYVGPRLQAVKWRDWKFHFLKQDSGAGEIIQMGLPMSYNIKLDPKEENPVTPIDTWVRWNTFGIITKHRKSLELEPPIPLGAPDPWEPEK